MKPRWLIGAAFLICSLGIAFGQPCDSKHLFGGVPKLTRTFPGDQVRILTNCGYVVGFSEVKKMPLWSAYHLRSIGAPCERTTSNERRTRFLMDTRTTVRINHDDYTNTGFDRGHMAPSYGIGTRFGESAQDETFRLSNICPQAPDLNQQTWRFLEDKEANEFANGLDEIWVVTGPIFGGATRTIGPAQIEVPVAFFKIIVDEVAGKPRALGFKMEQGEQPTHNFSMFLISVRSIEALTGINFFSELPSETERKLETARPRTLWSVRCPR